MEFICGVYRGVSGRLSWSFWTLSSRGVYLWSLSVEFIVEFICGVYLWSLSWSLSVEKAGDDFYVSGSLKYVLV